MNGRRKLLVVLGAGAIAVPLACVAQQPANNPQIGYPSKPVRLVVAQSIGGNSGPAISSTSAPCAASVRPATGPAITRDRSSTRTPSSGRWPAGHGFGAASPIFSMVSTGETVTVVGSAAAVHGVQLASLGDVTFAVFPSVVVPAANVTVPLTDV